MKFNCGPSKEKKAYLKHFAEQKKYEIASKGIEFFALWPVRISETECRCFEIMRKRFIGRFDNWINGGRKFGHYWQIEIIKKTGDNV